MTHTTVAPPRPVRSQRQSPLFLVGLTLAALAIAGLVVFPVGRIVFYLVRETDVETALRIWSQPGLGVVLANTALLVGSASVASVAAAAVLAWLNERTDARIGWLSGVLPILPLIVPAIASTIGWTFLLSPAAGLLNVALRALLAHVGVELADGPLSIFNWAGLILLSTAYLVPYAYVILAAAFRNVDPALEEASRICGRSAWFTFARVAVPAVLPAIGSAFFVATVVAAALFSIPVILGSASRIEVLSVRIVRMLTATYPPELGGAVVLSAGVAVVFAALMVVQARLAAVGYARLGGRSFHQRPLPLGRSRSLARAAIVLYVTVASLLPFAGLVLVSLQPFWTSNITFSDFGLANYRSAFLEDPLVLGAFRRSLMLGIAAATAGVASSLALTLFAAHGGRVARRLVGTIVAVPAALSHIVMAVGFILAFAGRPFSLAGTSLLLLLAYVVIYLPQSYSTASSSFAQIGDELVEASRLAGAGPWRTLRRVQLPLMANGMAAAWTLLFVLTMADLTASVMLAGTGNAVLGSTILDLYENGTYPKLAALAVVMTIVSTALVTVAERIAVRQS